MQGGVDIPFFANTPMPTQMDQDLAAPYQNIHWDSLVDLDEQPKAQLMTPNHSTEQHHYPSFPDPTDVNMDDARRLSPGGQPDITFTSAMLGGELEYDETLPALGRPTQDFTLYSSNDSSSRGSFVDPGFFPAIPPVNEPQQAGPHDQYAQLLDLDEDDLYT
jgi:hypothetical protein